MKKVWVLFIVLAIGLSGFSCNTGIFGGSKSQPMFDDFSESSMDLKVAAAPGEGDYGAKEVRSSTQSTIERKIVYTASVTIEIESAVDSIPKVKAIAESAKGFVSDSSISEYDNNRKNAKLTIKIPADNFDKVLKDLETLGKVKSQSMYTDDITEKYVDNEARLKNAQRLEANLINLLEKKSKELKDMLAVETELGRVREQIERFEGLKRYYDSKTSMATITVYLNEPYKYSSSIFDPLGRAFDVAGELFMTAIASIVVALSFAIPWLIVLGIVTYIIIRIVRFL